MVHTLPFRLFLRHIFGPSRLLGGGRTGDLRARRRCLRWTVVFLYGVLVWSLSATAQRETTAEPFRDLFNGRNLDGWVRVNTPTETWTVRDQMLICSGRPIGELRTDRMFQNFVLELEWRHIVPGGNAGVFLWADDLTAPGVPFHRGIEVQVLENAYGNTRSHTTHGDIFPIHGATMVPVNGRGGSRAFPTEQRSLPSPAWNHYRIVAVDGEVRLEVNGKQVTQGQRAVPRRGYICLESEGGIVHYRNIRLRELPHEPLDDSLVAKSDRGYRTLYSGLDLRNWRTSALTRRDWTVDDWQLVYGGRAESDAVLETGHRLARTAIPCGRSIRCAPCESAISVRRHELGVDTRGLRASGNRDESSPMAALRHTDRGGATERGSERGSLVFAVRTHTAPANHWPCAIGAHDIRQSLRARGRALISVPARRVPLGGFASPMRCAIDTW